MARLDPLHRANVLARFGRIKEARTTLENAIRAEPFRNDLRVRLDEFHKEHPVSGGFRVTVHLSMVWVLVCLTAAVVFGPVIAATELLDRGSASMPEGWALIGALAILVLCGLALCLAWVYLFLYCWFSYLKYVAGVDRELVERRLASWLNVDAIEPQYSRVRNRFFSERDGT